MTEHIAHLANSDKSLLLRELDHRIKNELTSAICAVSAKAVQSDSVIVKAALLEIVDFLHQWADVHHALHMPDQGRLPPAGLLRHYEIPTGLPGDTCLVFGR
jgi:two-component sensor histidine kinase